MAEAEPTSSQEGKERRRGADAMLRHRILIVSSEATMRRSLKRLMTATGAVTEFVNDLSKLPAEAPSLHRRRSALAERAEAEGPREGLPRGAAHRIVGAQDFGQMVEAGASRRAAAVVITYDESFEPEDFIITVTKLLHGQVFGLQKYFPWGVTLYNMEIAGYEEKVQGARRAQRLRRARGRARPGARSHGAGGRRADDQRACTTRPSTRTASRSISICRARRCRASSPSSAA